MTENDTGIQTVARTVRALLESGRFSDLTLVCRNKHFFVHQGIVCSRSPVWAAAVEGEFKEAKTKKITVDIVDARVLQLVLTYLYTGDYDDTQYDDSHTMSKDDDVCPTSSSQNLGEWTDTTYRDTLSIGNREHDDGNSGSVATLAPADGVEVASENLGGRPEGGGHEQILKRLDDGLRDQCERTMQATKAASSKARLETNTLVYILANYLQVPELEALAVKKFETALETDCQDGLGDISRLVYESAPSTALDLRSCLAISIASRGQTLIKDDAFMDDMLALPELLRDTFSCAVRQHQIASLERDAAISARLMAEEANSKGQEDKDRIIAQVNQARRCRHCSLENNVRFERETSSLGRTEYSFRCTCRTRY